MKKLTWRYFCKSCSLFCFPGLWLIHLPIIFAWYNVGVEILMFMYQYSSYRNTSIQFVTLSIRCIVLTLSVHNKTHSEQYSLLFITQVLFKLWMTAYPDRCQCCTIRCYRIYQERQTFDNPPLFSLGTWQNLPRRLFV